MTMPPSTTTMPLRRPLFAALVLVALLGGGCVAQPGPPEEAEALPATVRSIAVLPPLPVLAVDAKAVSAKAAQVLRDGATVLADTLGGYFAANPKVRMVSDDQLSAHTPSLTSSRLEQAVTAARAMGAEAVMLVNLTRYQERQGGDYGVQTPASVAFEYRLLLSASGQTLCAGSFDETQQAGSDNLLNLKAMAGRGFKWISAADLLREGVNKKLPDCQYLAPGAASPEAAPAIEETPTPPATKPVEPQAVTPPDTSATPPPAATVSAEPAAIPPAAAGVVIFLDTWRQAWEKSAGAQGDMAAYSAFYAPDFKDKAMNRQAFLADKAKKNAKKEWIRVNVRDLQVSPQATGGLHEVRFTQEYASSNFSDSTAKTLLLRPTNDGWQIVAER